MGDSMSEGKEERGAWQKKFVAKILGFVDITNSDAMRIMGLVCEERQTAYMEGHSKGFNAGFNAGLEKGLLKK